MLKSKSDVKAGQEIANKWRQRLKRGDGFYVDLDDMNLLLAYVSELELEFLKNNPYRIGKSWPGRKSIEGLDLVLILRRALAVCMHLPQIKSDPGVGSELLIDLAQLSQALIDANVVMLVEEKADVTEQGKIEFKA